VHLSYDAGGRVETVSRDGEMLRFEYDENDQLTKVSDVNGNPIIEYTYVLMIARVVELEGRLQLVS
jgi:YD repeat-containing protein